MKTLKFSILLPIVDFSELLQQEQPFDEPMKQPKMNDAAADPYSQAIYALQSQSDICVAGRYDQINDIVQYLQDLKNGSHQRCLMISGMPGLGKTKIVKHLVRTSKVDMILLNGISINSEEKAYLQLAQHFNFKKQKHKNPLLFLTQNLKRKVKAPTVILLDEIDQLLFNQHQAFLYNVLEWCGTYDRLALIGISNNVSFQALLNAKQKSRLSNKEILFRTYSPRELVEIVKFKLGESSKMFDEEALMMVAHEVSNFSSDVRKLLKVCIEALNYAKKDQVRVELKHMKLALCDDRRLKLFLMANDFEKIVLIALSNLIQRSLDTTKDCLDDLKAIVENLMRSNKLVDKIDEFQILKTMSQIERHQWVSFQSWSVFRKNENKLGKVRIKDTLVSLNIQIEEFKRDPLIQKHFLVAKPSNQTI